jgi:hypothetical protein
MSVDNEENPENNRKWAISIEDENSERVESVKAGVLSALSGSVSMTPFALIVQNSFYPTNAFSSQWEFSHDGLAIMLFLFGVVYRYAVRQVYMHLNQAITVVWSLTWKCAGPKSSIEAGETTGFTEILR